MVNLMMGACRFMSSSSSVYSGSAFHVAEQVLDHLMAPISEVLSDSTVTEIMMNSPDQIWIEREGQLIQVSGRLPDRGVAAAVRL